MNTSITIILVHGFWGGAAHWGKVIIDLAKNGYTTIRAVELPLTSLADDAERLRKMIKQQQGPVLLVGHSYGGAVITEAGNLPNVAGLVFIAAFAPDAGESVGAITQSLPPAAIANLSADSDGYLWINYDKYRDSMCQDISVDEALVLAVTQKAPMAGTFGDTIGAPAWKTKPCWYQISSDDHMINPENQKLMSARINPRNVITLPASHASLASRPADVSALIMAAAKAVTIGPNIPD